jgi:RimJ/RimL family protein N-acetyltransferase
VQNPSSALTILTFFAPAPTSVLETLRRKPLGNAVILKFLQNSPESVTGYHIAGNAETATMLVIDNRWNDFDRETYPTATSTALISSDNPTLTQALVEILPRNETLVFKLTNEMDRDVIAQQFPLERQRALLSYSTRTHVARDESIAINWTSKQAPFELFAAQGHSQSWLAPLIDNGRAFTCAFEENGKALSACFAFQIDDTIWEIGGVYTLPQARRRKLAKSVVSAAMAKLVQSNLLPRYQAEDTNTPSIQLAESLGMTRCLTLTHYLSTASVK